MTERKLDYMGTAYIVKHKNADIRSNSRSGGVFTAVSDWILEHGGIVYGCKMETLTRAIHSRATTKEERDLFRGSKYIQSEIGDCYRNVKKDLQAGKYVLFSGTSCQTAALKSFLIGIDTSKLFLVDIVCHGVPSPLIWENFIQYQEKRYGKISKVDFRNKKDFGWKDHQESIWVNDKRHDSGIFTKLFYRHCILRPSCYQCPYKTINTCSDMRIADAWGVSSDHPEFDDNKGVSLIILQSEFAKLILSDIMPSVDCIEIDLKNYMQPPLKSAFPEPVGRTRFWEDFYRLPQCLFYIKYGGSGLRKKWAQLKQKIKKIIGK